LPETFQQLILKNLTKEYQNIIKCPLKLTGIFILIAFRLYAAKKQSKKLLELSGNTHLKNDKRLIGYAFKVAGVVGYFIECITNKPLSPNNRENLIIAGALTPTFDDYCDSLNSSSESIKTGIKVKDLANNTNFDETSRNLFSILQEKTEQRKFEKHLESAIHWQIASAQQKTTKDIAILEEITINKGGSAFTFFASCTDYNFDENQMNAVHNFGAFIQLIDDIFDIYQDEEEGINTLVTINTTNLKSTINKLTYFIDKSIESLTLTNNNGKLVKLYVLYAYPAYYYLHYLSEMSTKTDFFNASGKLNEKYSWKGWNLSHILRFVRYLFSRKTDINHPNPSF
jgi:hypothetical protein